MNGRTVDWGRGRRRRSWRRGGGRCGCRSGPAGAARRRACITAARESAHACRSVLRGLALRGVLFGRALRLALRVRAATRHEARLPAGRLRGTLDNGTLAVLREQEGVGARLRDSLRALDVSSVVRGSGAVAGGVALRPSRGDCCVVADVVATLGGPPVGDHEKEGDRRKT